MRRWVKRVNRRLCIVSYKNIHEDLKYSIGDTVNNIVKTVHGTEVRSGWGHMVKAKRELVERIRATCSASCGVGPGVPLEWPSVEGGGAA